MLSGTAAEFEILHSTSLYDWGGMRDVRTTVIHQFQDATDLSTSGSSHRKNE